MPLLHKHTNPFRSGYHTTDHWCILVGVCQIIKIVVGQIIKIVIAATKSEQKEVISWITEAIMIIVNVVLGLVVFCMIIAMSAYTWSSCSSFNNDSFGYYFQKMQTYLIMFWVLVVGIGGSLFIAGVVVSLTVGGGAV
jgi:ABC-type multidrug transport system permease subunit